MPSYRNSMTSQIVMIVVIAIVIMQLYYFYQTSQVMDLFNTIVSGFVGAYLQRNLNQVPDNKLNEPENINVEGNKPNLHDVNDIQDVW